jgi:hypothetical protein
MGPFENRRFLLAITDLYLVKLIAANFGGNYGLHLIKANEYMGYRPPAPIRSVHFLLEEAHEKTDIYHSPDRVAGIGASETGAQERHHASRSLRADRPDRGSQTGLFAEVR